MKATSFLLYVVFFTISFLVPSVNAIQITNGNLVVNVRDDNGAVDSYILNGIDFFESGSPVSDWGMQVDTDTSSFVINRTDGNETIDVDVTSVGANSVEVKGTYTRGGANIEIVRTLSVLPNFDALVFSYRLTNLDQFDPIIINIFETFDPDQGYTTVNDFGTYNDVFTQGGFKIGQAVDETGLAFMIASNDPRVIIASGNPFRINSGSGLNTLITSPYDGEGMFADQGTHMVLSVPLEASEITVSQAAGGVVEANDPALIVGQPVDNSFIDVIETAIGEGDFISERVTIEEILKLEAESRAPVVVTTTTEDVDNNAAGASVYLILLFTLLALYRRKTQ